MDSLFTNIAELHERAAELKRLVSVTPEPQGERLRESLHQLEAAIYAMERNAADTYKALTSLC